MRMLRHFHNIDWEEHEINVWGQGREYSGEHNMTTTSLVWIRVRRRDREGQSNIASRIRVDLIVKQLPANTKNQDLLDQATSAGISSKEQGGCEGLLYIYIYNSSRKGWSHGVFFILLNFISVANHITFYFFQSMVTERRLNKKDQGVFFYSLLRSILIEPHTSIDCCMPLCCI